MFDTGVKYWCYAVCSRRGVVLTHLIRSAKLLYARPG